MTWEYPIVGIVAVVVAFLIVTIWLPRWAGEKRGPEFECGVCGRAEPHRSSAQWRYCPFCGTPAGKRGMRHLPNSAPSYQRFLDDEPPAEKKRRPRKPRSS